MKDRDKQIEELTKELDYCDEVDCQPSCAKCRAEWIIEQGYQKVGKDSVVLSMEEFDEFRKDQTEVKFLKKKIIEQASKETAEKIFKDIKLFLDDKTLAIITRYFKEILGVEIKEQK